MLLLEITRGESTMAFADYMDTPGLFSEDDKDAFENLGAELLRLGYTFRMTNIGNGMFRGPNRRVRFPGVSQYHKSTSKGKVSFLVDITPGDFGGEKVMDIHSVELNQIEAIFTEVKMDVNK
jgi:hypothetical protein